jgi:DNA-binding MarR family transcriptional regulator
MGANVRRPSKLELKAGFLEGLLGYRLRLAQQAVFRDFAARVATEFPGVSPGRVGILFLVEANPGVTQSRLAGAVRLDRSTLVGVLHVLQAQGLLDRRRGADRRTNGLWLTRAGSALAVCLKRRIGAHEKRVAARLSVAERARLLVLLAKLSG